MKKTSKHSVQRRQGRSRRDPLKELVQLRQAVGLLSTLAPTVEIDRDPVQTSVAICTDVTRQLEGRTALLKALELPSSGARTAERLHGALVAAWAKCDEMRTLIREAILRESALRESIDALGRHELFLAAGPTPRKKAPRSGSTS